MLKMTNCLLVAKSQFTSEKTGKVYFKARFLIGEELIDFEVSPQQFGELSTGLQYDAEFYIKTLFGRVVFVFGSYQYSEGLS